MPTEAGHSLESAASEYTISTLPADENTPLLREDNSTSCQHKPCEHFSCRHFLLIGLSLLSFAEVVLLIAGGIPILKIPRIKQLKVTVSLNVVEIGNCFFFLGIIVKSPSFAGFSTVLRDLCFLPNFWTLLLFFLLYLIGDSIYIQNYHSSYMNDERYNVFQLAVVEIILEILNFFTMMILVVFLNHTNLRYTISGRVWVYRMLKGTLVMFCFRLFVPTVHNIMVTSINLISVPDEDKIILKAQIINDILLLPFCKKIIELLWQKIFFDEKCIIGKIRRNRGTRQITFVV